MGFLRKKEKTTKEKLEEALRKLQEYQKKSEALDRSIDHLKTDINRDYSRKMEGLNRVNEEYEKRKREEDLRQLEEMRRANQALGDALSASMGEGRTR
ncbi:MAG: hypothetical protein IKE70_06470 [Bacilli bacterium]|nr:hypothetical protein [Bacilli bacterium]